MREKFGTYDKKSAEVWIKLDRADLDAASHESLRAILEGGQWETFRPAHRHTSNPTFARSEQDRNLVNFVNSELNRLVPKKVTVKGVESVKVDASGVQGQKAGEDVKAAGIYLRYRAAYPVILYALDSMDALGTGRHEAIHHLRQYGFFNPTEWASLKQAALAKDADGKTWLDRYNIHKLYPTGDLDLKVEEAIAERFKDWARDQDISGMTAEDVGVFQRLKELLDSIKNHIAQFLGKDPTWEDVFKKVNTGEVGSRSDTLPLDARAFNG